MITDIPDTIAGAFQTHPATVEQAVVSVAVLFKMLEPMGGYEIQSSGYAWKRGWNDALRTAMDYVQPTAGVTPDSTVVADAAGVLAEAAKWLHAAYDRPPQTPETVAMLARIDTAMTTTKEST